MPLGVLERQGVTHLWALGRTCSAWRDPIPRGRVCHQWCGYPQPSAGPTCHARGLGPQYCATCTLVTGGPPPLQNMQMWREFATGQQKNTCGLSTSGTTKVSPTATVDGLHPLHYYTPSTAFMTPPVNHRVFHANRHMAQKLVHHLRHMPIKSCLATRPPSIPPMHTYSSIKVSHPLFLIRCTAAAHSSWTSSFSLPPSQFTAPRVHVFAGSRATFHTGWRRVRATTAGDLPVATTTQSLIPFIQHIQTHITPCNPAWGMRRAGEMCR